MKTRSVVALLVLAGLLVAGCGSDKTVRSGSGPSTQATTEPTTTPPVATTTKAAAAKPTTSPLLYFSAPVQLPAGASDKLSVIASGPPNGSGGSTVPVVVRNNTSDTVEQIEVNGTARNNGALVGSGQSQGLAPTTLKPGEFTLGYVYFQSTVPSGSALDLTATAQPVSGDSFSSVDMPIAEVNRQPSQYGGDDVIGIVSNPTASVVKGPISVLVMCFQGNAPVSTSSGFTDADSVAPKGTASFTVSLPEGACPTIAVGASGYSF